MCNVPHLFLQRVAALPLLVCGTAIQKGWDQCPAPSVSAGEIERFVVDQIHQIGTDSKLITETIRQVQQQSEQGIRI